MAKKKDELDFDDDYDMDNFGDDGDFGDWEDSDRAPKKRNPVIRLAGSFVDGVKSTFLNRETHRRFISEAMPAGYSRMYDAADESLSSVKDLYDTARAGAGESAKELKKGVNAIVPQLGNGAVPEKMRTRMMNWAESAKAPTTATIDQDEAEMQLGMSDMMGGRSGSSGGGSGNSSGGEEGYGDSPSPIDAAEISNNIIEGVASKIQGAEGNKLLLGIKQAVERTANFQDQIHVAFMKKSIELQYRHYFVARKSLDVMSQIKELQVSSFDKIVHNTALPDLVKTQNSEIAHQMLKEKFLGEVVTAGSEHFGNVGRKVITKAKDKVKSFFKDAGAQIQEGVFGLSQVGELLGDKDSGVNIDDLAMQGAGGFAAKKLMGYITPKMKAKLAENPKLKALGLSAMNAKDQGFRIFQELLNGDSDNGIMESLKWSGFFDEFGFKRNETLRTDATAELDKAAQWDIQSKKTLNEVIPGWLSKIHAELGGIRTGGPLDPLQYSFETGTFEKSSDVADQIRESMAGTKVLKGAGDALNKMMKVVDPKKTLSTQATNDFKQYVLQQNLTKRMINWEGIRAGRVVVSSNPKDNQAIIDAIIINIYGQALTDAYELGDGSDDINRNLGRDVIMQTNVAKALEADSRLSGELRPMDKETALRHVRNGNLQHLLDLGYAVREGSTIKLNLGGIMNETVSLSQMMQSQEDAGIDAEAAAAASGAPRPKYETISEDIKKLVGKTDKQLKSWMPALARSNINNKIKQIKLIRQMQKDGKLPEKLDFPIAESDSSADGADEGSEDKSMKDRLAGMAASASNAINSASNYTGLGPAGGVDLVSQLNQATAALTRAAESLNQLDAVQEGRRLAGVAGDRINDGLDDVTRRLTDPEDAPETEEAPEEQTKAWWTKAGAKARRAAKAARRAGGKAVKSTTLGANLADSAAEAMARVDTAVTGSSIVRATDTTPPEEDTPQKHNGGIAGKGSQTHVGGGFNSAMRYHSGGVAGDEPNSDVADNPLDEVGGQGLWLTASPGKYLEYLPDGSTKEWIDKQAAKLTWEQLDRKAISASVGRMNRIRLKTTGKGKNKRLARSPREEMQEVTSPISNLKDNEVPTILEAGEEVLTEKDPRHRNNIFSMIRSVADKVVDHVPGASKGVKDTLKGFIGKITGIIGKQSGEEADAKVGESLAEDMSATGSPIADLSEKIMGAKADAASDSDELLGRIYESSLTMVELLRTIAEKEFNGAPEGFISRWRSKLGNGFTGAKDWTKAKYVSMRDKVSGGLDGARAKLTQWKETLLGAEYGKRAMEFAGKSGTWLKGQFNSTVEEARKLGGWAKDKLGVAGKYGKEKFDQAKVKAGELGEWSKNKLARTAESISSGHKRLKEKGSELYGKTRERLTEWKKKGNDKLDDIRNSKSDIYVEGNMTPIIRLAQLESGELMDLLTNKPVTCLEDITGPVVDKDGGQVVTQEEFDKGLSYPGIRKRLFGKALRMGGSPFRMVKAAVNWIKSKNLSAPKFVKVLFGDVFITGDKDPVMTVKELRSGEYLDIKTGKPITVFADITGPVIGPDEALKITQEQFDKGLVDIWGKSIYKSVKARLDGKLNSALAGNGMMGRLVRLGERLLDTSEEDEPPREMHPDICVKGEVNNVRVSGAVLKAGGYCLTEGKKVINTVADITGAVELKSTGYVVISQEEFEKSEFTDRSGKPITLGPLSGGARVMGKIKSLKNKVVGKIKGLGKKIGGFFKKGLRMFGLGGVSDAIDSASIKDEVSGFRKIYETVAEIRNLINERLAPPKKSLFNDKDGDGQRDGSQSKGFFARMKDKIMPGSGEEKDKKGKDGKDGGGGLFGGGFMGMLGKGLIGAGIGAGVAALASHLTGTEITPKTLAMGAAGGLALTTKIGRKVAWGAAKMVGRGALWAAKKVGGAVLKHALPAVARMGVTALAGAAGIITAPVALAIGATLLVVGGGYLIYKAMQNGKNPIARLRMAQYGFKIGDRKHVEAIIELETNLLKVTNVGSSGPAKIGGGPQAEEYMKLFNINTEDTKEFEEWKKWFHFRFKPVYLSHVTALFKHSKGKKDLHKADELLGRTEKLLYLKDVHFRNPSQSPYSIEENPFGDESSSLLDNGDVDSIYKKSVSVAEGEKEKAGTASKEDKQAAEDTAAKDSDGKDKEVEKKSIIREGIKKALMSSPIGMMARAGMSIFGAAKGVMSGLTGDVDSNDKSASWSARAGAAIRNTYEGAKSVLGMENDYRAPVAGGGELKWSNKVDPKLFETIDAAAKTHGMDANLMKVMAYTESRGDTNAKNPSGAKGIYQFLPIASKQYGISGQEFNMAVNVDAGARMLKDNYNLVKKVTGREPQAYELYLAHQQGPTGIQRILTAAKSGGEVAESTRRNMNANGGKGLGAQQFLDLWKGKIDGYMSQLHGGKSGTAGASSSGSVAAQTIPGDSPPAKLANHIIKNVKAQGAKGGDCARYVSRGLEAAGYYCKRGHAKDYIETNMKPGGWKQIDINSPNQIGDIVCWSGVPSHQWGHVQVWTGEMWMSDIRQRRLCAWSNEGGSVATRWRDPRFMTGIPKGSTPAAAKAPLTEQTKVVATPAPSAELPSSSGRDSSPVAVAPAATTVAPAAAASTDRPSAARSLPTMQLVATPPRQSPDTTSSESAPSGVQPYASDAPYSAPVTTPVPAATSPSGATAVTADPAGTPTADQSSGGATAPVAGGGKLNWSTKVDPKLFGTIEEAAKKYGMNSNLMKVMAYTESRGDTNAKNPSGAKGIYQFIPIAAKQYGITGKEFDLSTNVDAGARMLRDNYNVVKKITNKEPLAHELYLAHQQGPGGIKHILTTAAAGGPITNKSIRRNMNNNLGKGLDGKGFLNLWKGKIDGYMSQLHGGKIPPGGAGASSDPAGGNNSNVTAMSGTPGGQDAVGGLGGEIAGGPSGNKKMTEEQIVAKYGAASKKAPYLTKIDLPFPLRLSWATSKTVKTMMVHKLAANAFLGVFNDLLTHYGLAQIQKLGIDLFGGCFNYRKMRGGSRLSRHSWGIAIDLDPVRNGMKSTRANAQFAKPEYAAMLRIFAKHGFISYGEKSNFDWMHFELGTAATSEAVPLTSKNSNSEVTPAGAIGTPVGDTKPDSVEAKTADVPAMSGTTAPANASTPTPEAAEPAVATNPTSVVAKPEPAAAKTPEATVTESSKETPASSTAKETTVEKGPAATPAKPMPITAKPVVVNPTANRPVNGPVDKAATAAATKSVAAKPAATKSVAAKPAAAPKPVPVKAVGTADGRMFKPPTAALTREQRMNQVRLNGIAATKREEAKRLTEIAVRARAHADKLANAHKATQTAAANKVAAAAKRTADAKAAQAKLRQAGAASSALNKSQRDAMLARRAATQKASRDAEAARKLANANRIASQTKTIAQRRIETAAAAKAAKAAVVQPKAAVVTPVTNGRPARMITPAPSTGGTFAQRTQAAKEAQAAKLTAEAAKKAAEAKAAAARVEEIRRANVAAASAKASAAAKLASEKKAADAARYAENARIHKEERAAAEARRTAGSNRPPVQIVRAPATTPNSAPTTSPSLVSSGAFGSYMKSSLMPSSLMPMGGSSLAPTVTGHTPTTQPSGQNTGVFTGVNSEPCYDENGNPFDCGTGKPVVANKATTQTNLAQGLVSSTLTEINQQSQMRKATQQATDTQQQALDCAKQQLVVQNAILAQMNTLVKLVQNHQQNAGKPTNASNNAQATPAVEREASYPYGPKNQPPREMEQPPVPMRLI